MNSAANIESSAHSIDAAIWESNEEELRRLNAELERQAAHLKEVNQTLVDREQRLRLAIETGRIGLWVWNSTDVSNSGDWSQRLKEIFGMPLDAEVTHDMFLKCVHPDDRERVNESVMRALAGADGGVYRIEYRSVHPGDGSEHWVTARGQAFFDAQGQAIRFIGTVMDITERKQAEESANRLNVELERRIAERTADLACINAALQVEIEERKCAERELTRNKSALRLAIDTIPGLVWSSLPDGNIEYLNQRWLDYTGLTLEEASCWGWQQAVHPDDLPGLVEYWTSILTAGTAGEYEARLRRHDAVYRWFLFRGVPLYDASGVIVKWYGTNTDIEDRLAAERVAHGQLEAFTHLLDALAQEEDAERLLEHVARMIRDQTDAHTVSFWAKGDAGVLDRLATFQNDGLQYPAESATADQVAAMRSLGHPVWDEFFTLGKDCVECDLSNDSSHARIAGRENAEWLPTGGNNPNPIVTEAMTKIRDLGILTTLSVPMMISGRFEGMIRVRFKESRKFSLSDLELIKALARQAMITIEMMRLSRQSRQAAIISERNRLARDIHDTLAQGFTGVIVQLEAAEDARARGLGVESDAHLARARELAVESLGEARRSVQALRPHALTGRNLCVALTEMIAKRTAGTALRGEFFVEGEPKSLPAAWEEHLLHIGRETLTNTVRHARAAHFKGRLAFAHGALRLEFADDGQGFDPGRKSDGLGLLGMQERVAAMHGELTIRSAVGQGCTVIIVLPLPVAHPDHHASS